MVNRYISLAASGDRFDAMVALLFGDQPARELRDEADTNRDGTLDPLEVAQLKAKLTRQASEWMKLDVDGARLPFPADLTLDLGGNHAVTASPLVAEGHIKWSANHNPQAQIVVTPLTDFRRLGETEVTLALGPDWSLVSSQGPEGEGRSKSFKSSGRLPAEWKVTFAVARTSGGPRPARNRLWWALPLTLAIGSVGLLVRALRQSKRIKGVAAPEIKKRHTRSRE